MTNVSRTITSGSRIKGLKLYESITDYTVFDLETTGLWVNSDCKIIEISALKVRNDEVAETFSTLVNPKIHIPSAATRINHITDEMVENAPAIEDIFDDFLAFIGDDVLVGHNIDSFDYNIIYDLHIRFKGTPFQNQYIDTLSLAKKAFPELPSHKLTDLAEHLNIDRSEAHRAEKDCYMNFSLYKELKPLISENNTRTIPIKTDKGEKKYASVVNKSGMQNIFKGTACIVYGAFKNIDNDKVQNIVRELGAEYADYFCYSADYLILGEDMYEKYIKRIPDELIDSVALRTAARVLSERDFIYFSDMIISTESNTLDVSFSVDVSGKKICLTGEFACGEREQLENTLISFGAVIKGTVIKSLDYLVIGKYGNPDWKDGKGNKYIKAEKYNRQGSVIKIIDECDFIKGVN
ncbi:MAG: exonuclease domain-containing protein [Ruminococcus sp.]|nr:exonuclease domain-containing protein [Ruminococcus sp.]